MIGKNIMKFVFIIMTMIFGYVITCYANTEVSAGIYDVDIGQTFTVDVNVKTTVNLSDLTIVVAFNDNGNVLEFDANDSGLSVASRGSINAVDANSAPNSIKFVFGGLGREFAVTPGEGWLFSFKLTARQVGSSSLTFPEITPCIPGLPCTCKPAPCTAFPDPYTSTDGTIDISAQTTTLSIRDASPVFEGDDSSSSTVSFTVSLNQAASADVSVDYTTQEDTAGDGSENGDNDYTFKDGTLDFSHGGNLSQMITIMINGDSKVEATETFKVVLSNASISLEKTMGIGTITNDDTASLSINDVALSEGNSTGSPTTFEFTVSLDNPSVFPVVVDFSTADDTALLSDGDYEEMSGTLTIDPNVLTESIIVSVNKDDNIEPAETFFVNLTNAMLDGASDQNLLTINDAQGTGTILDDDNPSPEINSITRAFISSESNIDRLHFSVTFTRKVQSVDDSDFMPELISGTLSFTIQPVVKVRDHEYLVPVTVGTGEGTVGINIKSGNNIEDLTGQSLGSTDFSNESFVIWRKNLTFANGWNLLSIPGPVFKQNLVDIFENAVAGVWSWNGANFSRIGDTQDIEKLGFWIYFSDQVSSVTVRGVNAESLTTEMQSGWNLIGVTQESSPQPNVLIKYPVWAWKNGKYVVVDDLLEPFSAYWIYAKDQTSL